MRDFDEDNLTGAVLDRVNAAPDPRTRTISAALVRHLHAFIKEIEPTEAEWTAAIDFLTGVGRLCSETRQEFILLSDTLGASMLVDAINHRPRTGPDGARITESTVLGPFYVQAAPEHALGDDIGNGMPGEPLRVEGRVHGPDGQPVAGAIVDTWQADAEGSYDVQGPGGLENLAGRARFRTAPDGTFWFRSVVPASYPIPNDGPVGAMLVAQRRHPYRPAHVHFMVGAPGYETLVTHVFLAGDPYLDTDVVFGVKNSLITELDRTGPGPVLRYDFVLAPA